MDYPCDPLEGHRKALEIFYSFGILPQRTDPIDCPHCGEKLRTTNDSARKLGWRFVHFLLLTTVVIYIYCIISYFCVILLYFVTDIDVPRDIK